MNFVELVHSGKYDENELSQKSMTFLKGMRHIQKRLENYKAECDPDEEDGILGQIESQIMVKTIDWLVDHLECDICEYIVCTLDDEYAASESYVEDLPFC